MFDGSVCLVSLFRRCGYVAWVCGQLFFFFFGGGAEDGKFLKFDPPGEAPSHVQEFAAWG